MSSLLPRIDLSEILLEINALTGFADEFTHVSEKGARASNLSTSICAQLIAEACNIGIQPLQNPDVPAHTRSRLSWVKQNYIREETLLRANAKLVNKQSELALAKKWGGGEVASADGLRFVVAVPSINARSNKKYYGPARGITYYNFTSDRSSGFHWIVLPGTRRDSSYILNGLLEQQTKLNPTQIMADTAGVSDLIFGLFWLLGYQFSPRMADVGEARFWRFDPEANYGALDSIARHRINPDLNNSELG